MYTTTQAISYTTLPFTAIDRWTFAYLIVASLALAWHWSQLTPDWQLALALVHGLILMLLCCMPSVRQQGSIGQFLGYWYPLILILVFYTEVGVLNLAGGRSFDEPIQKLEDLIFGSQVATEWIRSWPNPLFSWLLHFSYAMYYPIVVGTPMIISRIAGHEAGQRVLLMALITFYIAYTIFLLTPTAGPLYLFPQPDNAATQTSTAIIVAWLLEVGDAWGSAFPSCHVAVTVVLTVTAFMEDKRVGLALAPLMVLLTLATIYGQIHYAVDALAGILLASCILMLRIRLIL